MKILLINPRDNYTLASPPLAIGYLKSYAEKISDKKIYFHDENFIDYDRLDQRLEDAVKKIHPDFIGVTFPSSTVKRVYHLSNFIKKKWPEITLFAGGYHPTSEPEATLKIISSLDFLILGQAEHSFGRLDTDWQHHDNIAYLNSDGTYIQNPIHNALESLDSIPIMDRSIFDERYIRPNYVISGIFGKTVTMMTSRGCPFNCAFCSNKLLQKKVKFHSVGYVIEEIDNILSKFKDIDYLFFLDVMFLTSWRRTEQLCRELIKSKISQKVKWAATVSANVVSEKKIKLLKEAGCFYLSFGFESNSRRSLKLMKKTATPEDNANAADLCKKYNILCNSAFLIGIPGEKEEDLEETLKFVKKYNIFSTGVNIMRPLPGSPFYDEFVEKGIIGRNIEDWHTVSSIHHGAKYFNTEIPESEYENFCMAFNKTIRFRQKFDHYSANLKNLIKYRLLQS